ncbi:MAG TPA: dihydroxyacetone kinase phosphoryl donor subunit DhaM [Pseudonocardiaceae bacterium]|jgi:PTS hybrid protein|nr:dihydroxyacetone kinase phosphoryl donor subunit DhaM [Pseudonocardiaceae bacterium]
MSERVGLVIVSHSRRLAAGVVELAGQMAPGVPLVAAGGMPDGGLGTDFAAVESALAAADQGAGVVLLFDLGSARMTADMAVETLADPTRAVVADAPLVEGAVAAAVAAAGGADLAAVVAAAEGRTVAESVEAADTDSVEAAVAESVRAGDAESVRAADAETEIVLTNEVGLHARPAALLARSVAELDAKVVVRLGDQRADGASVLALLGLAARKDDRLTVTAWGPQAEEAISRIQRLADDNFNEAR